MHDNLTKVQRHRCMSAIHGRDTKPEMLVRSLLHKRGFRFRLHVKDLPGTPDIVLPKHRTVVFVHGCFWHKHRCRRGRAEPATNRTFWRKKRAENVHRDRAVRQQLRRLGWRVIILWECEIGSTALPEIRSQSGMIGSPLPPNCKKDKTHD